METHKELLRVSYPVPYYAQIASPELAARIFDEGLDPRKDPKWKEFGAIDQDEYAYWVDRACGVVCVKMCVEALGGAKKNVVTWAKEGLSIDGYLIKTNENGIQEELGWIHKSLANLVEREGFSAEARPASILEIVNEIREDRLIIASVSFELGTKKPVERQGGHLVVVVGADLNVEGVGSIYIHNPSGRTRELREFAKIPVERFGKSFAGRIIAVSHGTI
ncbi:MAG: C39 family peptidase [Anaerolineaceae bacterium]|nr:C39 family peptidase [Anaerolineaceae bacterium]